MYSRDHAILSALVAAVAVFTLDLPVGWPVVVAVGIDFDHFLVARLTTGEWTALRRCLANPRIVVLDQDEIFEPGSIWPLQRLLSHVLIAGVTVSLLALWDTSFAVFVGAVLYVHVLADLVWDVYRQDGYHRRVRELTG